MTEPLWIVVLTAAAYLLGAVPFGLLAGFCRGIDVRRLGSGNIGATNVFRTAGKPAGLATLLLDAAKGFTAVALLPGLAAIVGGFTLGDEWRLLFGVAAVAGHNWPVYLRFKGGKGVATAMGVLLGLDALLTLAGGLVWVVCLLLTGYVSVASMTAALVVTGWAWVRHGTLAWSVNNAFPLVTTLLAAAILFRHRSNINRLLSGRERRMSFRRKSHPEDAS